MAAIGHHFIAKKKKTKNPSRHLVKDDTNASFIILSFQDKSCCLGPHSVKSLLNEGDDIIHVFVGSGWTTDHLATLTSQDHTTIYAFGVKNEEHHEQLMANAKKLGITSILIIRKWWKWKWILNFLLAVPSWSKLVNDKFWMNKEKFTRAGFEPATWELTCWRSTNWTN